MKMRLRLLGLVLLTLSVALYLPVQAHNYYAPYLYLSGVYSPDGHPAKYLPASDAEMEWLLQQIKSSDKNVRAVAVGALGQTKDPRAVEPLLTALKDEDEVVRMNAVMAFVHIKDPRVIEPIAAMVDSEYPSLARLGAEYALVNQGDAGIDKLISLTQKSSREGGQPFPGISESIMLIKGEGALQWAVDALQSKDKNRYRSALEILESLCFYASKSNKTIITPSIARVILDVLLTLDPEQAECSAVLLINVTDKEIVEKLISIATDEKNPYKGAALIALSKSKDPRITPLLKSDDDDKEEMPREERAEDNKPVKLSPKEVKEYAAEVRKARGNVEGEECLDSQEAARRLAISTNPEAFNVLCKILHEKNPAAARVAARALGMSNNPKAQQILTGIAKNPKHSAYHDAVDRLILIQDSAILTRLLQSKEEYAVTQVIGTLNEKSIPPIAKHLIPLLADAKHKEQVAVALARVKEPAAISVLVSLLKDVKADGYYEENELIGALMNYEQAAADKVLATFNDPDPAVRKGAVIFFRRVKDKRSVDPLTKLLADPNVNLRRQAIQSLIFQADAKAAPHYISLLKDPDQQVRRSAAQALALTPDPSASDDLVPLLKDNDKCMKTCAAVALGQLGDSRGADEIMYVLTPDPDEAAENPYLYTLVIPAVKAAGKIKDKRAVVPIVDVLGGDIKLSSFDAGTEEEIAESRNVKLDALKAITGQDFGYAFYRWMAWSIAQGYTLQPLIPGRE